MIGQSLGRRHPSDVGHVLFCPSFEGATFFEEVCGVAETFSGMLIVAPSRRSSSRRFGIMSFERAVRLDAELLAGRRDRPAPPPPAPISPSAISRRKWMNASWFSALLILRPNRAHAGAVLLRLGQQLEGVVGRAGRAAEDADDEVRIVVDQLLHRLAGRGRPS